MPEVTIVIFSVIIVSGVCACYFWKKKNKQLHAGVAETALIMKLWARQGPFHDGAASSIAWQAAHYAISNEDPSIEKQASFEEHRKSYDADPDAWEENQIRYAQLTSGQTSDPYLTLARAAAALYSVKAAVDTSELSINDVLEDNFEDRLMFEQFGSWLIKSTLPEARDLSLFLAQFYRVQEGYDPKTVGDFGKQLCRSLVLSDKKVESEFSKEFRGHYDRFCATSESRPPTSH